MRIPWHSILPFLLGVFSGVTSCPAAPATLLHTLLNPGGNTRSDAWQGYRVAIDGDIIAVGAVFDETRGPESSGVVNVYDTRTGALLHRLIAPNQLLIDNFGSVVAVSGMRVVVGARSYGALEENSGGAYVYDLSGITPDRPVLTLTNPAPGGFDSFGSSLAISGARLVVGAYENDFASGGAYVYDLNSTSPGIPVVTLTNPSPNDGDLFGLGVAISGTRVVVGAGSDDAAAENAGIAYVYDLAGGRPDVPLFTLKGPNPAADENFGNSAAIAGALVVVGARGTNALGLRSAYVYDLTSIDPVAPVAILNDPNPVFGGCFGPVLAISGARVAVGTHCDDFGSGRTHIYDLAGATPSVPSLTLTNPSPGVWDYFGWSVAIDGTRVVVGAPNDDTKGPNAGMAYLYHLDRAAPQVPVASLKNSSPSIDDSFGYAVAMSGSRIVVGAPNDDAGAVNAGAAYVYSLAGATSAVLVARLNNPAPANGDSFGYAVAMNGRRVVVGAPGHYSGAASSGSAYVYDIDGSTPTVPIAILDNPSPAQGDFFGSAVAISDAGVVVGARFDDSGGTDAGSAYAYNLLGATPTIPIPLYPLPHQYDYAGCAVTISDSRVLIGAYGHDRGATNSGATYGRDLAFLEPIVPAIAGFKFGPVPRGQFGTSIASSSLRVVVGAPGETVGTAPSGRVYVYTQFSNYWASASLITTLADPGVATNSRFGSAVAVSGTRVAVGAYGDDVGGPYSGSAYVYETANANPNVPIATVHNPNPAAYDYFGYSVAIDGMMVAVGAYGNDTQAPNNGAVYIFALGPTLIVTPTAPGLATLSWTPPTTVGFVLQYTENFASTNWLNAPSGGTNPVTISITNASRFYQLSRP